MANLTTVHDTADAKPTTATTTSLLRAGGIAAIAAGVITQVSGALHPVETQTLLDPAVHLREVAANPRWDAVYFGFTIGFIAMLIALTAIARMLRDDGADALGALAKSVATATTAVALVFFVVDGFATKLVADAVVAAPNDVAVLAAGGAIDKVGRAFFGHWVFLSWGVTPILFGLTTLAAKRTPKLLAIPPLVSGLLGAGVGIVHDFKDFSLGVLPPFYASILIFNVWLVVMGVTLLRRAASSSRVEDRVPLAAPARI